jgi:hypothetical protein
MAAWNTCPGVLVNDYQLLLIVTKVIVYVPRTTVGERASQVGSG